MATCPAFDLKYQRESSRLGSWVRSYNTLASCYITNLLSLYLSWSSTSYISKTQQHFSPFKSSSEVVTILRRNCWKSLDIFSDFNKIQGSELNVKFGADFRHSWTLTV